jgi:anti-sigma regulatory factor (Ser/Thr protein kinase)
VEEPLEMRLQLPVSPRAPRLARCAIEELPGLPPEKRRDALLVVSELVTNAVVHAGPFSTDVIRLTVQLARDCLRIDVQDREPLADSQLGFRRRKLGEPPVGTGVGLKIVDRIADDWYAEGGRVWASLRLVEQPDTSTCSTPATGSV